jgi:hypothetical protein
VGGSQWLVWPVLYGGARPTRLSPCLATAGLLLLLTRHFYGWPLAAHVLSICIPKHRRGAGVYALSGSISGSLITAALPSALCLAFEATSKSVCRWRDHPTRRFQLSAAATQHTQPHRPATTHRQYFFLYLRCVHLHLDGTPGPALHTCICTAHLHLLCARGNT